MNISDGGQYIPIPLLHNPVPQPFTQQFSLGIFKFLKVILRGQILFRSVFAVFVFWFSNLFLTKLVFVLLEGPFDNLKIQHWHRHRHCKSVLFDSQFFLKFTLQEYSLSIQRRDVHWCCRKKVVWIFGSTHPFFENTTASKFCGNFPVKQQ